MPASFLRAFGLSTALLATPLALVAAQTTPAQTTPAQTTPAQTTPAQTTPAQTTPAQTTPAQPPSAPVTNPPVTNPVPAQGMTGGMATDTAQGGMHGRRTTTTTSTQQTRQRVSTRHAARRRHARQMAHARRMRAHDSAMMAARLDGDNTNGRMRSEGDLPLRKQPYAEPTPPVAAAPMPMPAPAPMPMPAPMPEPPAPPAPMPDTTTVTSTTVTTTTTVEQPMAPPMHRRLGNGFQVGIRGGAAFLPDDWTRRQFKSTGYAVGVPIGFDPKSFPVGLRLDLDYQQFQGRDVRDYGLVTTPTLAATRNLRDGQVYSALLNAKARVPFGNFGGATHGFYVLGGGGVAHLRHFNQVGAQNLVRGAVNEGPYWSDDNLTRFALNGGAGLSFALGRAEFSLEGRYLRAFTPERRVNTVPVTLGISVF